LTELLSDAGEWEKRLMDVYIYIYLLCIIYIDR
jgi:hypothetical protein